MAAKIGVFLALDNEQEFSQGLKNAQASARLLQDGLKSLSSEYRGSTTSFSSGGRRRAGFPLIPMRASRT